MKVYVASPFFNEFERTVKGMMYSRLKLDTEDLTLVEKVEFLEPEDTEASKKFAVTEDNSEREKLAKEVFKENLRMINECDLLIFPRYTDDIGTLFEVGYAMGLRKNIARFNYLSQKFEQVEYQYKIPETLWVNSRVSIDGVISAVRFGYFAYLSEKNPKIELSYILKKGISDNIMFSANWKRYDEKGNLLTRNWEEVR